jgi:uncharacterized protein YprB with RNaseH-like and TPR domain
MTTLAERLRGVVGTGGSTQQDPPYSACWPGPSDPAISNVADTLDGEWREADGHRYLVVERKYLPGHRHGDVTVADSLPPWGQFHVLSGQPPGSPPRVSQRGGVESGGVEAAASKMLFLDLETTGLAGGAGTYAFLVGTAWFHGGVFRTRQFFLASYTAERALLEAVAADAGAAGALVTFNGKSFDIPLIDTRFVLHRMQTPFAGVPHVDMVHPARRLWKPDEEEGAGADCRLTRLEETLCGLRREGDVPGYEIPSRYFHYVRTGDARPLHAVFEHNRLDLLALAMVTARAAQLLEEGPPGARTAREAYGLGRLYERVGRAIEAAACYLRAEQLPGDVLVRAEALRAYAVASRRVRRYEEAAGAWRRLLALKRCPPALAREATEALAVHHEHRARDLHQARRFAVQSLQFTITAAREHAIQHRLARLERKIAQPAAALF